MSERLEQVAWELESLYKQRGGLDPQRVVAWARTHPRSALHSRFEWDNSKAAERYRVWQARELITEVEVIYPDKKARQVYVSPLAQRGEGGYLTMVDVLSDGARRADFLQQALDELHRFEAKYADLEELAEVFEALKRAVKRNGRRKAP